MKKTGMIILLLCIPAAVVLICGCGGEEPSESNDSAVYSYERSEEAPEGAKDPYSDFPHPNPVPRPRPSARISSPNLIEDQLAQMSPPQQAKTLVGFFCFALTAYRCHVGEFPTTEEGLLALANHPKRFASEELLTDPWGNRFVYKWVGGEKILYELYSLGPDGKQSEDDIRLRDLEGRAQFAQREYLDNFVKAFEASSEGGISALEGLMGE